MGIGTRIFLGGGVGYICFPGTQHHPERPRGPSGIPTRPAGTLMVIGDLKQMNPRYLVGVSLLGYGCSLAVGLGVPIPLLNEEMAHFCAVTNEDIITPVVDYGQDYPAGSGKVLGEVTYAQLMSGNIMLEDQEVPTVPLSSLVRAREVANTLKDWILNGALPVGGAGGAAAFCRNARVGPGRGEPGKLSGRKVVRGDGRLITPNFPSPAAWTLMQQIITHLRRWPRAVLLFSGGLDSSLLLALGRLAWGKG